MSNTEEIKENVNTEIEGAEVQCDEKNSEEILISNESMDIINKVENHKSQDGRGTKKNGFASRLLAGLLDQVICVGLTVIILFIISAIIHVFGYRFLLLGNYNMFIILYIIINVLYVPVIESTKLKRTFGKMFLKI